ncbi:ATP-dependent protease [Candidatus Saccharibacteria bacterium]|nr:ATP-dependent protease [Candidatus Saccharibacteria bacterium]
MLAKINTISNIGLDCQLIVVEADISNGLPGFMVVGLANKAVDEAKERVRSAIKNSGLNLPPRKITLNLAPADLPKNGSGFDLAMAVSLLLASKQINTIDKNSAFLGELGLDGTARPIAGALSLAQACVENNITELYISAGVAKQAALIEGITIYPVESLSQLYRHLIGESKIIPLNQTKIKPQDRLADIDLSEIYGQEQAKRAIELAASGNHNILLSGPPGSGKSMLAKSLIGLLPEPSYDESIEITKIHSLAGQSTDEIICNRPYRSPHHTASSVALIGGGQWPKPGEISLAHRGVLFLDEIPEFARNVLEVLRQPLEEGRVTISRASTTQDYPARFLLVAAQNPCPCGYAGDQENVCSCSPSQLNKYSSKVSGPLLDRIDIVVRVQRVKKSQLMNRVSSESSADVKKRVINARKIQQDRFRKDPISSNNEMTNKQIEKYCDLNESGKSLMEQAINNLKLSARAYMRVLKLSRTIADLDGSKSIETKHIAEALQYRA